MYNALHVVYICVCLKKQQRIFQERKIEMQKKEKTQTHALSFKVVVHCDVRLPTNTQTLSFSSRARWKIKAYESVFAAI